jgi:hypothetical protein
VWLAAALPAGLPVVLTGASRADRIATLTALFGHRLHLIAQNPLQYARHGALMTQTGRVRCHARVEDLFAANVRHYAGLLDGPPPPASTLASSPARRARGVGAASHGGHDHPADPAAAKGNRS